MCALRDYQLWHKEYDDPRSDLSWRLRTVQGYIRETLNEHRGPFRVLSLCSGDGRDLIDVLAERDNSEPVSATLVELHPDIAQQARERARRAGLRQIEVRTTDGGLTDAYTDVVPADLVLLVGIFGNVCDEDVKRTVDAAPQLCRPAGTLIWSRGREQEDLNDVIRAWFGEAHFTELDYAALDTGSRPALGAMRYDGAARELVPNRRLFTFIR
jgi:hypothetical protein